MIWPKTSLNLCLQLNLSEFCSLFFGDVAAVLIQLFFQRELANRIFLGISVGLMSHIRERTQKSVRSKFWGLICSVLFEWNSSELKNFSGIYLYFSLSSTFLFSKEKELYISHCQSFPTGKLSGPWMWKSSNPL